MIYRYLHRLVKQDLNEKIVIMSGPRNVGKTTMAKNLGLDFSYYNIDNVEDNIKIKRREYNKDCELLILDEFHKINNWKRYVKGIYDTQGLNPKILITGSAKLETFRNVGDSLAGRFYRYRLHPIDIAEACNKFSMSPMQAYNNLINCSGFPEPFIKGDRKSYTRWKTSYNEVLLQEDILYLIATKSLDSINILIQLLKNRVGASINYSNLAQDLQASSKTVKSWYEILENLYHFFKITPYHKNIAKSILKEPKAYCFDVAIVKEEAARLENIVALSLLKRIHFLQDTEGSEVALHYCRTKDSHEIDFYVEVDSIVYLIEVKTSDDKISRNFAYFAKYFNNPKCFQLVLNLERDFSNEAGYKVCNLVKWLADIEKHITSNIS